MDNSDCPTVYDVLMHGYNATEGIHKEIINWLLLFNEILFLEILFFEILFFEILFLEIFY